MATPGGTGSDFAIISAVLGIESPVRALIAALGVILVFTAFFWLPFSLMAVDGIHPLPGADRVRRTAAGAVIVAESETSPAVDPLLLTTEEAAKLRVGRTLIYEQARRGALSSVRVGRSPSRSAGCSR